MKEVFLKGGTYKMKKRDIKCSLCKYGEHLEYFKAWTCRHPECKEAPIFKGLTHPHCCPLVGGKNYITHKNHKPQIEVRLPLRG